MKYILIKTMLVILSLNAQAQTHEMKQLLLNIEKLSQFRQNLKEMYHGYKVLSEGYSKIKSIAEGNFNLHDVFLDGLLKVSPAVKRYERIGASIRLQTAMVSGQRQSLRALRLSDSFSNGEMDHFENVYKKVLLESFELLEQLIQVLTDGDLRMSDDERMKSIDHIYQSVSKQHIFLMQFTKGNQVIMMQREKEKLELQLARKINGTHR